MKQFWKRCACLVLALVMLFSLLPTMGTQAEATDERERMIIEKIDYYEKYIKENFYDKGYNAYWNAYGRNSEDQLIKDLARGDIDSCLSTTPCMVEDYVTGAENNKGANHVKATGCLSNMFNGCSQCQGFAQYFAYYLFGSKIPSKESNKWEKYDSRTISTMPELKVGDHVLYVYKQRVYSDKGKKTDENGRKYNLSAEHPHAVIVRSVDNKDKIHVVDCNHFGGNSDRACIVNVPYTKNTNDYQFTLPKAKLEQIWTGSGKTIDNLDPNSSYVVISRCTSNPTPLVKHNHDFSGGATCKDENCSAWKKESFVLTTENQKGMFVDTTRAAVLRTGPYAAVNYGKVSVSKGTPLEIIDVGYNSYGPSHVWYRVAFGGKPYYVYIDNVGEPYQKTSKIAINLISPVENETLTMQSVKDYKISGYIVSNYSFKANKAVAKLTEDATGETISSSASTKSETENISKLMIGESSIGKKLKFSDIKDTGNYTLTITVTDCKNYVQTFERHFKVVSSEESTVSLYAPEVTYSDAENGKKVTISNNPKNPANTMVSYQYYGTNGVQQLITGSSYEFFINRGALITAYCVFNPPKRGTVSLFDSKQSQQYTEQSDTVEKYVTVNQLKAPTTRITMTPTGAKVFLSSNEGAKIYYSINGGAKTEYRQPLVIFEDATIEAYAAKPGYLNSDSATQTVRMVAPETPRVSLLNGNANLAQNATATIRWDAIGNAAEYTVKAYLDGVLNETKEHVTQPMATFILREAGKYSFTVSASNAFGTSAESTAVSVTSKAPLTVTFVDWDGTVLSEQKVDYGSGAVAPADPERIGYYFRTWNQSFTAVTEDLTITPIYKIHTYTVKFVDADGHQIDKKTVDYGQMVTLPAVERITPPSNSYAFVGWSISAESASSKCDLSFVDSNMTAQAVFEWINKELPVTVTSVTPTWDAGTGLYTVAVDLETMAASTQGNGIAPPIHALVRVSLKTSDDKMVKTESRTVELTAGGHTAATFSLNYSGTATIAEAVVLGYDGDYLTGSTYSAAVSAPVTTTADYAYGEWSEWLTTMPEEAAGREIASGTQYRYRDLSTTSSTSATLSGWTLDSSKPPKTNYTNWTNVGWTRTRPTESDTLQITNTKTVTDAAAYTQYTYYHWWGYNSEGTLKNSYGNLYWKNYESFTSKTKLAVYKVYDKNYPGYKQTVSGKHGTLWWLKSEETIPAVTHMEWYYQTRTAYKTYYFYKWGDWSLWQGAAVSKTDSRDVETRTVYRYRDKNVPVSGLLPVEKEDQSGKRYPLDAENFTGTIATTLDLSGKYATVMVYKGKNSDPNESQLQYVGQIQIGEGNAYSFNCKLDAPTENTGDYTVALSLQGSTGLINVDLIPAPPEVFTVTYYGMDNTVISVQKIERGSNAVAPASPTAEGYRFIAWSETGTNVQRNMDIMPVFVTETYAVAFVDWINESIFVDALDYGTDLYALAESIGNPTAQGHSFAGWTMEDGTPITSGTRLTGNTVIVAKYEPVVYTVNFYSESGAILDAQQIAYGESAVLPEAPEVANMLFISWSTDAMWWNVTDNLDVYPIYIYENTAEIPVAILNEDYQSVTLHSERLADIYYTLDGSIPSSESELYTEPIEIDENTVLRAIAIAPEKNESEILEFSFDYDFDTESNAETSDLVEIGTYTVNAEHDKDVTLQVNMGESADLAAYLFTIECDRGVFYLDYDEENGFAATQGEATPGGMMFCSTYDDIGYQVLWFGDGTTTAAGNLFSLTLKVCDEAEEGNYPITVSYSPANTVTEANIEALPNSVNVSFDNAKILGDVNSDGIITTVDVVRIARYIIDDYMLTQSQIAAADVTGDGNITAADVIRLARYIVGLAELG